MVEGPGCKLKGEKLRSRIIGQVVKNLGGNAVDKTTKKSQRKRKKQRGEDALLEEVPIVTESLFIQFIGKKCVDIQTLGKELFIFFENVESCLRVHFLMAGGFRLNGENLDGDGGGEAKTASLHLQMTNDQVKFNKCGIEIRSASDSLKKMDELKSLDICVACFSHCRAVEVIQTQRGRMVCDVLLDQLILPGVGNIIKNEALFDSGIRPNTRIEELTEEHISHLVSMTRDFTMIFYKCRKDGKPLQPYMKVYRKGKCTQCGGKITTTKMGEASERLTCFCAQCQNNDLNKRVLPMKNSLLGYLTKVKTEKPWACTQCTLLNNSERANCEVCLAPKVKLSTTAIAKQDLGTHKPVPTLLKDPVNLASDNLSLHPKPDQVKKFHTNSQTPLTRSGIREAALRAQGPKSPNQVIPTPPKSTLAVPPCPQHGLPCRMNRVHKTGENHNRMFYSCSVKGKQQCKYFKWADDAFPFCEGHGKKCVLRTVMKLGANNGRRFFACSVSTKKNCNFFKWADDYATVLL